MIICEYMRTLFPRRPLMIGLGAVLSILVLSSSAFADDWLLARHDAQSTGVAESTLAPAPRMLWKYEPGDTAFEATAVVENGVVYVGDADGTLHAVDLASGEVIWTKQFDDTGFLSAAAVDGERLWVGDFNGVLWCLSTKDGSERWQQELAAEVMAGPMLYEGKLLITTEAGTFTCHDAETGQQQWEFVIDAPLRCTPTVVAGRAMLAGCDGKLHAIDLKTGATSGGD